MKKTINWGIMGCGSIAREFADALSHVKDAKITAAVSASGHADSFADQFNITNRYQNYEEFVKDESIDVVYIATTHNFHYEQSLLCLNNNKHVLCEKPVTLNAIQAYKVIKLAKMKNLFYMEAMWTRFAPLMSKLKEIIDDDTIGTIKTMRGNFCIDIPFNENHRLYNRDLAGGALLDLGIYPLTFATMVLDKFPQKITSSLTLGKTGVDELSSYLLEFDKGETALLTSACNFSAPIEFEIFGTKGRINVSHFIFPKQLTIVLNNGDSQVIDSPHISTGKNYEAEEVVRCLQDGEIESKMQTHAATLKIMEIMDTIRKPELLYPGE